MTLAAGKLSSCTVHAVQHQRLNRTATVTTLEGQEPARPLPTGPPPPPLPTGPPNWPSTSARARMLHPPAADTKPSWLSKPAYLDFATLRSYPLRQLHRLAVTLHDRILPLGHPAVQTLVRQLLHHIGTFTNGEEVTPPRLLWRTGWESEGNVLEALYDELAALAEELDQTPREHETVLLLGEVASYLAAWHPPCRTVARRFATMATRFADEFEPQLAAVRSEDHAAAGQLFLKQCRWRCIALTAWSGAAAAAAAATSTACSRIGRPLPHQLTDEDVSQMLQLMVLITHGQVFLHNAAMRDALAPLLVRVHNVMVGASNAVLAAVTRRPAILTDAVARVLQQRTPASLTWQRLGYTGSFEAVQVLPDDGGGGGGASSGGEGCERLISINTLNGTVLIDGWPPGRLPKEVTQHHLYRRTFDDWSFEIALTSDGVMHSLRPVAQRLYDFALSSDGQRLTITETDPRDAGSKLELLDVGPDDRCDPWGSELPVSLRRLYSHWISRSHGVMVLRGRNFQVHAIHFVVRCRTGFMKPPSFIAARGTVFTASEPIGNCGYEYEYEYDCRRVPPPLRQRTLSWLIGNNGFQPDLADRLVLLSGCAIKDRILSRFEHPDFIHSYIISINASPSASSSSSGSAMSSSRSSMDGHTETHGSSSIGKRLREGTHTGRTQGTGCSQMKEQEPCQQQQGLVLLLELPRYGLEFGLRHGEGQVLSRTHSGYRLHHRQLLVSCPATADIAAATASAGEAGAAAGTWYSGVQYTLPEFQQYLVLERVPVATDWAGGGGRQEDTLVLVPAGGVAVVEALNGGNGTGLSARGVGAVGCVRVNVSNSVHAQNLKVRCSRREVVMGAQDSLGT